MSQIVRSFAPKVDQEKCIGCGMCQLYCPESTVKLTSEKVIFDYRFCKGCGVCAYECPAHAIKMVQEEGD